MRRRGLSTSQGLVTPETCALTAEELPLLAANREALDEIGFALEPFGDRTVLIRAVPQIALQASPGRLLQELLREAASGERSAWAAVSLLERLTIATACHTAIKAGDILTGEQMVALLRDLADTEDPFTCFHGRPTIVTVPVAYLERWFYRK
jgi:DNA mismatch repair protein MutL